MKRFEKDPVRGWLHDVPWPRAAIALTHGAGSSCEAPFLVAVAEALESEGYAVLRYDLPFRQERAHGSGPMNASLQARDREGIVCAASELRSAYSGAKIVLAGHSYGGRQSSMVAASDPSRADVLLLLSYPLHPPRTPQKLRTEHLPSLHTPCLFVHGTRDPFGTIEEMEQALKLIPAKTMLQTIPGGAHNLPEKAATLLPAWLSAMMDG